MSVKVACAMSSPPLFLATEADGREAGLHRKISRGTARTLRVLWGELPALLAQL